MLPARCTKHAGTMGLSHGCVGEVDLESHAHDNASCFVANPSKLLQLFKGVGDLAAMPFNQCLQPVRIFVVCAENSPPCLLRNAYDSSQR
jgi:hypothetical protein